MWWGYLAQGVLHTSHGLILRSIPFFKTQFWCHLLQKTSPDFSSPEWLLPLDSQYYKFCTCEKCSCLLIPIRWYFIPLHVFYISTLQLDWWFSQLPFFNAYYVLRSIYVFEILHLQACTVVTILILHVSKRDTRVKLLAWGYINTVYQNWIGILYI